MCPLYRSGSEDFAERRASVWVTQLLTGRARRAQAPGSEAAELSTSHVSAVPGNLEILTLKHLVEGLFLA